MLGNAHRPHSNSLVIIKQMIDRKIGISDLIPEQIRARVVVVVLPDNFIEVRQALHVLLLTLLSLRCGIYPFSL